MKLRLSCLILTVGFMAFQTWAAENTITLIHSRDLQEDGARATLGSTASRAEVDIDDSGLSSIPSITLQGVEDGKPLVYSKQTLGGASGGDFWYGEMDGEQSGTATVVQAEDGSVSASFSDDKNVYQMNTLPDGTVVVDTIAYDDFEDDVMGRAGSDDVVGGPTIGGGRRLPSKETNLRGNINSDIRDKGGLVLVDENQARELNSNTVVDVLVVYTRQAMCAEARKPSNCGKEHRSAIEKRIRLAEAETNLSYRTSGISARIKVVRMHLDESGFSELNGDFVRMLQALQGTSDKYLKYVHSLRKSVRADLVSLVVEAGAYCGYGNVFGAFSVAKRVCTTGYYSFGHELAHNMGCFHDRRNAGRKHAYAHGYQDPSRKFRSVMAYNCPNGGCKRVPRYSNRKYRYLGKPVGDNEHDCARQIDRIAPIVAKWN